jgi:hypothetical protein
MHFFFFIFLYFQQHYFRRFTNHVVKITLYILVAANTAAPNLIKILTLAIFSLAFAPMLLALLTRFHQNNGSAMQLAAL